MCVVVLCCWLEGVVGGCVIVGGGVIGGCGVIVVSCVAVLTSLTLVVVVSTIVASVVVCSCDSLVCFCCFINFVGMMSGPSISSLSLICRLSLVRCKHRAPNVISEL